VPAAVKLSSPATAEFWEIPVIFEDDHLLVLDKPAGLLVSPDAIEPERPSLMALLHRDIKRAAKWMTGRNLDYLANAHRLDAETTGPIILVKNKAALVALAAQFGSEPARRTYLALAAGSPAEDAFNTEVKLGPNLLQPGVVRVDPKEGKRSRTDFTVRERFNGWVSLECKPMPDRSHQVRAHLRHLRLPLVGDDIYGGQPLLLSSLKSDYRLKPGHSERPLISRPALHLERIEIEHPATREKMTLTAPPPKDVIVSIKYLRRYAGAST
jgi:RluA family pseudouridine synthase